MQSAAEVFEMFERNRGAVFCGGAAVYYVRILQLFGFEAFTVNFGDACGHLTHVTVVVALPTADGWAHYLFDPTFNGRFVEPRRGRDLPVRELLSFSAAGQWHSVELVEARLSDREFVYQNPGQPVLESSAQPCEERLYSVGDTVVCRGVPYDFDAYLSRFQEQFEQCGYSQGISGFFELLTERVFSVGSSPDAAASEAFRALLEEHGIPVGAPPN